MPERAPVGAEGFLARQRRKLLHADFRGGEMVAVGRPSTSLNDYRRSGRVMQFFERSWALIVTLWGLVMFVCGGLGLTQPVELHVGAILAGVAVIGGYAGLYHLAGWRCMRRHRKRRQGY